MQESGYRFRSLPNRVPIDTVTVAAVPEVDSTVVKSLQADRATPLYIQENDSEFILYVSTCRFNPEKSSVVYYEDMLVLNINHVPDPLDGIEHRSRLTYLNDSFRLSMKMPERVYMHGISASRIGNVLRVMIPKQ